ncbi:hypothetical protein D3C80_1394330 [compost metagenome]
MMVNKGMLPEGYIKALDGEEYKFLIQQLMGITKKGQLPRYPNDQLGINAVFQLISSKFSQAYNGLYSKTKHDANLKPQTLIKLLNLLKNNNCNN